MALKIFNVQKLRIVNYKGTEENINKEIIANNAKYHDRVQFYLL